MNAPENLPNGVPVGDVVGASIPQLASGEKVQGRADYTDDLTRPGMLHGAVLGSIYFGDWLKDTLNSKLKWVQVPPKAAVVRLQLPSKRADITLIDQEG